MRTARIKVDETDTWYHCYNRVCGAESWRPFHKLQKQVMVEILQEVSELLGIKVVSYQIMSNHYHLLVQAPEKPLSPGEMCERYKKYYKGFKTIEPDSEECAAWCKRSRDVSWFMRLFQQKFTMWFNRNYKTRRRGKLWCDRYKHTILESGSALWNCWKYIENNAVRAGLVKDAADYRFCSYGRWCQSGHHPFAMNVIQLLLKTFGCSEMAELKELLRQGLGKEAPESKTKTGISTTVTRRVRYWTEGLVIGSERFVREVMAPHYQRAETKRLARSAPGEEQVFAWRTFKTA